MSVAITGWNDRQMINACLLYRFCFSYEPRDFHGKLDEMPATMRYGQAVDEMRRRHREWLWDAEFCDTKGARVLVHGEPLETYAVYQRSDGRRAVVFANMSDTSSIVCEVQLEQPRAANLRWFSPENPNPKTWSGTLEMASGTAATVFEA
jgi:hypothetical protein